MAERNIQYNSFIKQEVFELTRWRKQTTCPLCDGDHGNNTMCQMSFDADYFDL